MNCTVDDLCRTMQDIAPLHLAASWDNTGLILGRHNAMIERVMLCIDLTDAVAEEAVNARVHAVVAYHPPLFEPIKSLTDARGGLGALLRLAEAGIAVYSPHSALDATPNGITDWLAAGLGSGIVSPLQHAPDHASAHMFKLVTYVPGNAVDTVHQAMSESGAGRIGDYSMCSTRIASTGTFMGKAGTAPAIGQSERLETVEEFRLMMVCHRDQLADAVAALRRSHPYEEPPVHIIELAETPLPDHGLGRLIQFKEPTDTTAIADRLKVHLGVDTVRVAKSISAPNRHTYAACCCGAGGSMLSDARRVGATIFITGEMRHHDVLLAIDHGITVILAGHTNTERGFLPQLRDRLATAMPNCQYSVSQADRIPWRQY